VLGLLLALLGSVIVLRRHVDGTVAAANEAGRVEHGGAHRGVAEVGLAALHCAGRWIVENDLRAEGTAGAAR
jgi:hypothetical protein